MKFSPGQRQDWLIDEFRRRGKLPPAKEGASLFGVTERTIKHDKEAIRDDGRLARVIVSLVGERAASRYFEREVTAEGKLALDAATKALDIAAPQDSSQALAESVRGALGLLGVTVRDDIRRAVEGDGGLG